MLRHSTLGLSILLALNPEASAFSPSAPQLLRSSGTQHSALSHLRVGPKLSVPQLLSPSTPLALRMAATMDPSAGEASAATPEGVKYLSAEEAKQIDQELMDEDGGWPLASLMEVAGKSLAEAITDAYPLEGLEGKRVVIVCGKGNNGGDGLVAAKHLKYWGYSVQVVYPNRNPNEPFRGLVTQLKNLDIEVNIGMPGTPRGVGLIVDAIFGFGYRPPLDVSWEIIIKQFGNPDYFGDVPVLSVDVPSGWNVDLGPPVDDTPHVMPEVLVSLTAPKKCARSFQGKHYLAGRFVPPRMQYKYKLNLPEFEGTKGYTTLDPPPPLSEEEKAQLAEAQAQAEKDRLEKLAAEEAAKKAEEERANAPVGATKLGGPMPGVWEDPDPAIDSALKDALQQAARIIGEKRQNWDKEIRSFVFASVLPLGYESSYPPHKTQIAKLMFLVAKTLDEKEMESLDMLSEGRYMVENAFEDYNDLNAGKVLRAYATQYGKLGEGMLETAILEEVDRIIEERGLPEDLEAPPPEPYYTMADKWDVAVVGPDGEATEATIRPKQKVKLLMNAWLASNDLQDQGDKFEFYVPEKPKSWKTGPVTDPEMEIGETGLLDGYSLLVRAKEE